ncbi:Lar-like restriction alleviation protein [Caulobacter phage CcrBL9]|uniref:Uncharacterized protein n=1 Tax=Caulobacter phage CcrBL9 TaxID=2283270 RepID=A0A385EFK3_9CAUD|nr:Lar-like restriction alleviation protein [Caulobacter phage CcrBL9]AXQ69449.1 hypothetical protein CcrBL9_gp425 [Caulobacter phage CcrBL9]
MITLPEPLKPCPFCGGPFAISQEPHDNHPIAGMYYIYHTERTTPQRQHCRITVDNHFHSVEEAVTFWNGRHVSAEQIILPKIKVAELCYSMGWTAGYGQALVEKGLCLSDAWDLDKPEAIARLQAGGEDPGEETP